MTISDQQIEDGRRQAYEAVNATRAKYGLAPIEFTKDLDPDPVFCSFCGKEPRDVANMVEGVGVFICDNCILTCAYVLAAESE